MLAPAFAFLELSAPPAQTEDVRRILDQAVVVEFDDMLLAQALDIEGIAADEMPQPLHRLGRANQASRAAAHRLAGFADGQAVADRAVIGEFVALGALGPRLFDHRDDLRNYIAGALQDDAVADADVLTLDLVFVMQGRAGDDHAAHRDRLQYGNRRQRARASDLDRDIPQPGLGLLGRKLVGQRPARRAAHHAQALLPIASVHFVDDPVDVIGEFSPPRLDFGMKG